MATTTTLDEMVETVLRAREEGPDAIAAVAMAFGASMVLGTLGNITLKAKLAELREAMTAADEDLATLRRERDALRARPTYEARATMPTPEECAAHEANGGVWYITGGTTLSCVVSSTAADAPPWAAHWVPVDRDGLPCAWPVVSGEVAP